MWKKQEKRGMQNDQSVSKRLGVINDKVEDEKGRQNVQ